VQPVEAVVAVKVYEVEEKGSAEELLEVGVANPIIGFQL
jgi:hypothetical protein